MIALFPGPYIHVGGDEAVKDQWRANPAIQSKIKALGLKDEDALQGWFTAQIGDYLAKRGRRMVGWDEILGGRVAEDAVVMSWHGIDGAITAAKSGRDAVLAPSPIMYLDHMQSDSADEPGGRAEIIGWRDFYNFDPTPAVLTADERRHLLGLQGNLWTEHIPTTDDADRMLWPRAAIVAELAWSNPKKDWPSFSTRLAADIRRSEQLRLGYNSTPLHPEAIFTGSDVITATLRQLHRRQLIPTKSFRPIRNQRRVRRTGNRVFINPELRRKISRHKINFISFRSNNHTATSKF